MEAATDLTAVQARLRSFRDAREWGRFHSPGNLAKAISVEAAELLELFLWTGGEGEDKVLGTHRAEVEAELADVMIQCLNLANAVEIDVIAAINRKIDVNEERYPPDQVRGSARKYTEL